MYARRGARALATFIVEQNQAPQPAPACRDAASAAPLHAVGVPSSRTVFSSAKLLSNAGWSLSNFLLPNKRVRVCESLLWRQYDGLLPLHQRQFRR